MYGEWCLAASFCLAICSQTRVSCDNVSEDGLSSKAFIVFAKIGVRVWI